MVFRPSSLLIQIESIISISFDEICDIKISSNFIIVLMNRQCKTDENVFLMVYLLQGLLPNI
jgi:hypothetical protein